MKASVFEQKLAQTSGVRIKHWSQPHRVHGNSSVTGIELEYTRLDNDGRLVGSGETYTLEADVVFTAIGQNVSWDELGDFADAVKIDRGRVVIDDDRRTSVADVWAGGDCVLGGDDLTVSGVQDGKIAAISINEFLGGT